MVLLCFCFLTVVYASQAQVRGIRFEQVDQDDGLSQSSALALLQDRTGFLWIGTQVGLNRYDGYGFEVYKHSPRDPESLPENWVETLYEDHDGELWVGTQGGLALWQRQGNSFASFRHDPDNASTLSGPWIRAITEDSQGVLWVGTQESGLNRRDPITGSFERFQHDPGNPESLGNNEIRALHVTRDGRLWVGTLGGLDVYDPSRGGFRHFRHDPADPSSLSDDQVRAIYEDPAGNLWIGTFAGLNRLAPGAEGFDRFLSDPRDPTTLSNGVVRSILRDDADRLWIGTEDGLNLWNDVGGTFSRFYNIPADPASLSHNEIYSILQDDGGVLWVATFDGVNRWNPKTWSFAHYRADPTGQEDSSNSIFAFSEDSQGRLWAGSFGGLARIDRTQGDVERFRHDPGDPGSLPEDRVTTLLHDHEGTLWLGTRARGLARYRESTGVFEVFSHDPEDSTSLSRNLVTTLFEDGEQQLWIGTYGGGLNRLRRDSGTFERFEHSDDDPGSISSNRIFAMDEDREGLLWLATDDGLSTFDGELFRSYRHDPDDPQSLGGDTANVVHIDARGRLFAGTQGQGLARMRHFDPSTGDARFQNYTKADGLPDNTVWGIESDASGNLWLSTTAGFARFDPETEEFQIYDTAHGLQGKEFNLGAHYKSPRGELFFGGTNGFNAFYPDNIVGNTHVPPIVLTSFFKLNEKVSFDRPIFDVDEIDLDYNEDFVSFEFAALDYTAPEKNQYRYRLQGLHDEWIDLDNRRRIDFTNLDPGHYTLRVQGSNNDGVWNEEGLAIDLTVTPPFWQTWWFRGAGILLLGSMVLVSHRVRMRSIRVINERLRTLVAQRTRELEAAQEKLLRNERLAVLGELAGSVAHEIRNPLGVIRNSIYFLRLTQKEITDVGKEHLELIEQQIVQTNRIIAELLDYARDRPPQTGRFDLHEAAHKAVDLAEIPETVSLDRTDAPGPLFVEADLDQISRLIANLLRNAVQAMTEEGEGEGGDLWLTCGEQDGEYVATVRDSGVGIADENLAKIFEPLYTSKANGIGLGLALSQRYARLNHGRIECESRLGEGATFRLILPPAPDVESSHGV